jgi:hypothetical protein
MRTIDKILTKLDCKSGSPMGRDNVGKMPVEILPDMTGVDEKDTLYFNFVWMKRKKLLNRKNKRIFDCKVELSDGYDKGGAYWGSPNNLRVRYTKDLNLIYFYRK